MTSSLVGSEMCIRDRAEDGGTLWRQVGLRIIGDLALGTSVQGENGSSKPVSYTHLTLPTICSV
eukprot:6368976-Prorocentrum_lima.AAC.1